MDLNKNQEKAAAMMAEVENLPQAVAEYFTADENIDRSANREGLDVNEMFTITGWNDKPSSFMAKDRDNNDVERSFFGIKCSGDIQSIGLSTLIGSIKMSKYFPDPKGQVQVEREQREDKKPATQVTEYSVDFSEYVNANKILRLPKRLRDAAIEVQRLINSGTKLKCIGKAEDCGFYGQTFYLFGMDIPENDNNDLPQVEQPETE